MKKIGALWGIGRMCGRVSSAVQTPSTANLVISPLRFCSKDAEVRLPVEDSVYHVPLTKSQLAEELSKRNIRFEKVTHGNFLRVNCVFCDAERSCYISGLDNTVTCVICHEFQPLNVFLTAAASKKSEISVKNESIREKRPEANELLRLVENPEEVDPDLYDRVSYLNLVNQIKEEQRREDGLNAAFPFAVDQHSAKLKSAPPDPHIQRLWDESMDISDMSIMEQNDMKQLRTMLGIDRISAETLSSYNVRGHLDKSDQASILYPRYRGAASHNRVPEGLKLIRKVGNTLKKENYPFVNESSTNIRFYGIFGYHLSRTSDNSIVLTTNERDALAVYEASDGIFAFALPHGEHVDNTILPYLEDFEHIFLWFPSHHQNYAKEWGHKLDDARCSFIKSVERPIELLRSGKYKKVRRILWTESIRLRSEGFLCINDLREHVKADLVHSDVRQRGFAQWKRFAPLNRYLQGLRPKELTVLTGGTGFGKTTFLCEYSLDLFTQGVRTLFCSFEMPEEKILKWMLVQYAGVPLYRAEYSSTIDMWLDKFERTRGPLTIMKTIEFRDKSINQIAAAISNHVINSGCQHVVIDNLQFLVNQSTMSDERSTSLDRFQMQDRFVGHMRALATQQGVHVTMVVHPRKTDANTDLDIQHFGGSARVTQEADNVLALQRRRDDLDRGKSRKFLYILKNRYGGQRVEKDQLEMLFQSSIYSHTIVDHSLKV
ncbi:hypothetical protein RB195_007838 [Necator americanus]|uniref:SF4 helicase domain-containing protein n=1 Tax=Necator americanus TaxID=51031 RepID=A0ABR1C0Q0_NECAM